MRVLVVSQYFWPENFRINAIVESLVNRGIEVEVLTGKPNYPEGVISSGYRLWGMQRETWQGALLHRVPLIPRGRKSHLGLSLNYLSFIIFGCFCGAWMLRKRPYDVIFVYGLSPILLAFPALFLGWLKNIKVATWIQDLWPESLSATGYIKNRPVLGAVRLLVRYIYRHSDLLLVQSRAFETPARALTKHTPIVYYPNSVDEFFSQPLRVQPPQTSGFERKFTVLFAGNIGAAQGVQVIVEAAACLRENSDIGFVVLGDGSCREEMMQLAAQQHLNNIHFPGRFPVETMPGFMQKASALLVTLTEQPIFAVTVPNKIQAYLAVGKPILASLNGEGARLVVESGAGLATAAEDAAGLADAVTEISEMTSKSRQAMGDRGREYYRQHFDHEMLVGQLLEQLQDLSSKQREPS